MRGEKLEVDREIAEEVECVTINKEQQGIMEVPSSPLKDHFASFNLEEKILDMVRISSPSNISRIVEWLDENKGSYLKVKKKNSRDPSPVLPTMTRSHGKSYLGVKPKSVGRKHTSQVLQEETRRNLVDGSQRTILECSG